MVEVQLFLEGLFSAAGALLGNFVASVTHFVGGLGSAISGILNGLNLSR